MSGAVEGVALAACPFCGGTETGLYRPTEARGGSGWHDWFVRCHQCHVESAEYETEAEAITAWNTRTTPPARSYADEDVETQWEVWEDDLMVASSTDEADARHYLAVYSQDGPVRLVKSVTVRTPCDPAPVLSQGGKA